MRGSYTRRLIPIMVIIAAGIWVVLPNNPGIHFGPFDRDIEVVRGLDLQGGLQVLLEADWPSDMEVEREKIETTRRIIEDRVNGLGVTEPLVQVAGDRRILVELPGIGNPDEAIAIIKETGLLEFIALNQEELAYILSLPEGQTVQTDFGLSEPETPATPDESTQEPSPGEEATPEAVPTPEPMIFHTVLTGADLQNAGVVRDQAGIEYVVAIEFTEEGGLIFGEYTATHVGEALGILLDKKLISSPLISEPITGGSASITGDFTLQTANSLAIQLRYGSLPVPMKPIERKVVGPTLGQDSLQKSTVAGLVGLGVVMLFMALYYRLPGLLADLALLVYATLTFALFKLIPVTLTLPGIAGFVLSIGVAVDANILIFERMKEELRGGRSLRQAIDLGFSRAWPSIRDSNLSTLITCGILYWFGNTFGASIVKGFSFTLALGVLVSLFTAITVTRTFLHVVLDNIKITEHPRWFGV
ncbi:MAG: protein translocase subunit SecD [Anaerolineales bacterium]